jgi:clan AA aspartic protease (TIGR02281 family)
MRAGASRRPVAIASIARVVTLFVALGAWAIAADPARAEVYRWTDEAGRLHFASDLNQVPPKYRRIADAAASAEPDPSEPERVQTFKAPPPAAVPSRDGAVDASGAQAVVHRIRVSRAGSSMQANVLINGRVTVPFILDTGASDVVLPEWAANELGLDLSNSRTAFYRTANGVISSKLTNLDSVKLGTAEVRDVPTSISTSMETGLLGLSFFNHFKYDFDPASGVVTLTENDLAESGKLRGGRSQGQWESQFRAIHARIKRGEEMLEEIPFSRTRKRARMEEAVDGLRRELELLEGEADDAKVPFAWRD